MGVFSDDFATVDVREELCYHSRPEKRKFKRCNERQKPMIESHARRKKRQPSPERFSGDGSAPPRFRFGFPCCSCCLFRGVCLAAASAASRTCIKDKHTSRSHTRIFTVYQPHIWRKRLFRSENLAVYCYSEVSFRDTV